MKTAQNHAFNFSYLLFILQLVTNAYKYTPTLPSKSHIHESSSIWLILLSLPHIIIIIYIAMRCLHLFLVITVAFFLVRAHHCESSRVLNEDNAALKSFERKLSHSHLLDTMDALTFLTLVAHLAPAREPS
ncbi:hypothetical protein CXB51_021411 [Gossypium anomalum]|uniref:Uncharacterized protein n=1 Tax=Gossypium anomalum TaxID=47600 RepID=A0A8J5YAN9_9ROSI|nr:hypothetical protein CXB51_021411 [Gossypium anomalum]